MVTSCLPSCESRHSFDNELISSQATVTHSIHANSTYPYDSDPYDPRKPEYMCPASPEEVNNTNMKILGQQIHKLETIIKKSKAQLDLSGKNGKEQVVKHYERIMEELRRSANLVHSRVNTELELEVDVDEWQAAHEFEVQHRETQAFEVELQSKNKCIAKQCDAWGVIDEYAVEHESLQIQPSIKACPGELLRHCSTTRKENMKMSQFVPQSIHKQRWPSNESVDARNRILSLAVLMI